MLPSPWLCHWLSNIPELYLHDHAWTISFWRARAICTQYLANIALCTQYTIFLKGIKKRVNLTYRFSRQKARNHHIIRFATKGVYLSQAWRSIWIEVNVIFSPSKLTLLANNSDFWLKSVICDRKTQTSGQIQISYKYRNIRLISRYTIFAK